MLSLESDKMTAKLSHSIWLIPEFGTIFQKYPILVTQVHKKNQTQLQLIFWLCIYIEKKVYTWKKNLLP